MVDRWPRDMAPFPDPTQHIKGVQSEALRFLRIGRLFNTKVGKVSVCAKEENNNKTVMLHARHVYRYK